MKTLIICVNHRANPDQPSCARRGSLALLHHAQTLIEQHQLAIKLESFKCLGVCDRGPNIKLVPEGHFIHEASKAELNALLLGHSIDAVEDSHPDRE